MPSRATLAWALVEDACRDDPRLRRIWAQFRSEGMHFMFSSGPDGISSFLDDCREACRLPLEASYNRRNWVF